MRRGARDKVSNFSKRRFNKDRAIGSKSEGTDREDF